MKNHENSRNQVRPTGILLKGKVMDSDGVFRDPSPADLAGMVGERYGESELVTHRQTAEGGTQKKKSRLAEFGKCAIAGALITAGGVGAGHIAVNAGGVFVANGMKADEKITVGDYVGDVFESITEVGKNIERVLP